MARQLLLRGAAADYVDGTGTCAGVVAGFILCVFAVMACAHRGWGNWRQLLVGRRSGTGSDPVISIQQVQPELEGDVCLWQRSIIMGEKCRLPDFSGIINYDSAGNLVKKPSIFDELRAVQ